MEISDHYVAISILHYCRVFTIAPLTQQIAHHYTCTLKYTKKCNLMVHHKQSPVPSFDSSVFQVMSFIPQTV